jgi:hypothetical protein
MIASLCGPECGVQLFVHVLGALLLFGAVATVTILSVVALSRPADQALLLRRVAFATTLAAVWPGYIVMRVGAQWVLTHENLDTNSPSWVGVGFVISDAGILVLLLLTLFGWLSRRRAWAGTALAGLSSLYLVALGVAWFYMSAKP